MNHHSWGMFLFCAGIFTEGFATGWHLSKHLPEPDLTEMFLSFKGALIIGGVFLMVIGSVLRYSF